MEINVNVKISLTEETALLLTGFLTGMTVTGPKETAPVINMEKPAKEKAEKPAKTEKPVKAEAAATTATQTGVAASRDESGESEEVKKLRLDIREKVVKLRDAGKKDDTVKLMQNYGITQLSKLPEDKLTEFLDELNAVK